MSRTITVSDETFALLEDMREAGFARSDLVAQIVRQYAIGQGRAGEMIALPTAKPDDISDRAWHILIARFEGRASLDRVGKVFGITRERVRQIEAVALRKHPEYRTTE